VASRYLINRKIRRTVENAAMRRAGTARRTKALNRCEGPAHKPVERSAQLWSLPACNGLGRISGLRGRGPEGRGLRGNLGQWEAASTAISVSSAIRILQVTDYFGASSVPLPLSPSWRSRLKRFHEAVERHLRFLDIGGGQRISELLILCANSMPKTIRNEANARRTRQGRRKSCIDSKRVLVSRAGLEPATLLLKGEGT